MQNRQNLMHFEQENGQKSHFGPFLALIEPTLGPTKKIRHIDHHYLLDIITLYHNMQNWQKLMHFEHENGLKPHLAPFLALIRPILGPTISFSGL